MRTAPALREGTLAILALPATLDLCQLRAGRRWGRTPPPTNKAYLRVEPSLPPGRTPCVTAGGLLGCGAQLVKTLPTSVLNRACLGMGWTVYLIDARASRSFRPMATRGLSCL